MQLRIPELRSYIAGEFYDTEKMGPVICNPHSGEGLANYARTYEHHLEQALKAASEQYEVEAWLESLENRITLLNGCAKVAQDYEQELCILEAETTGTLYKHLQPLMRFLPKVFLAAVEAAKRTGPQTDLPTNHRSVELWNRPVGAALCVTSWNAPLLIGAHKLASAIAAGAPVILKPSEHSPFSTQRFVDLIASLLMPPGVIQLVHGFKQEVVQLVNDTRLAAVSFTGGEQAGVSIAQSCARAMKPCQLELGGHNPAIVCADADLSETVDHLVKGMTHLNGQWCRAIGQIFVQDSVYDRTVNLLKKCLEEIKIGASLDQRSELGPLVNFEHRNRILDKVGAYKEQGAKVWCSSQERPPEGAYMPPTIITDLSFNNDIDEIFGPVVVVHRFSDLEALIRKLNRSRFGLASYLFSSDENNALAIARRLRFGSVKVNGVTLTSLSASAPRTAWRMSGLIDEGVFESVKLFQKGTLVGIVSKETI